MKLFKILLCFLILILCIYGTSIYIMKHIIYPTKYEEYVCKYSEENNVDKYLIYAIIKTESNFNNLAKSNKEAKGLMQLLDTTAKDMLDSDVNLYNSEININAGTKYIRYLLDKYDNNIKLAICAYNAGLGNVNDWITDKKIYNGDIIISNIPFKETRSYLITVLKNYEKYMELYK